MYNLCILTSHFYPIKSSCSSLFRDLIKSMLNENFNITVISISGTQNEIRTIKTKKLTYISIKNSHLKSGNNYLRALGEIAAILKIRSFYNKNNFPNYDQVIVYSPSIFWSIFLLKLKKKIVTIKLGDLYPKWLVDHKIINKFSPNYLFLKFFEMLLYFQADNIYVQTKKDINYLSKYKKILSFNDGVIYNWINTKSLINEKNTQKKRKYVRFIFLGVIGVAQDYKLLDRMIKFCKDNNLQSTFFFIGSGTEKEKLIELTKNYNNVFFFPEMSIHKIDKIIKQCDVCISTLSKNFYSENFPGKILRYMVNNKPILAHSPNNFFLKNLIEKHSLGLFSSEEDKFYENIMYIFSNFIAFKKKGINGLEVAKENFSSENAKKIFFPEI